MAVSSPILCGSIAGSLGGLGIKMHNAAYRKLAIPYSYVSFEPNDLKGAINAMRCMGIRGLGVSMPFKIAVMDYLDELDDAAKEIGAVNTIVNDNGHLKGYNTDAYGAEKAISEVFELKDKKVVILGAGGVGRTIAWAISQHTKDIIIYNNNEAKGSDVANRFGLKFGGDISQVNAETPYDIILNCTSVGFKSKETILMADRIRNNSVVFDVIFNPLVTKFQKEAKSVGCTVIPGSRMIMYQACRQFELYTGFEAPVEVFEREIKKAYSEE